VCLEIIATTYRSTIYELLVFNLYSDLCIDVSILLPIDKRDIWTSLRAIRGAPEDDDRVNLEIHIDMVVV
jgi:hypothetical protein